MIKRVIEVSNHCFLSTKLEQLHIENGGQLTAKIPIEDIGLLLLANPYISLTQALVCKCMQYNVAVIFCDSKYVPTGLALPLFDAHSLHTKVIQNQTTIKKVLKNQIWQSIVKEKIGNQARTLDALGLPSKGVKLIATQVQSSDRRNHEAQAARLYWKILFNGQFRRDPDLDDINVLLNYGYAIVRATVARAIVAAGLHPALGVFHKNQYNAFCLADDLMEPIRPWVDFLVITYYRDTAQVDISQEFKRYILGSLSKSIKVKGKKSSLFVGIQIYVNSYKESLENNDMFINYPNIKELTCLLGD